MISFVMRMSLLRQNHRATSSVFRHSPINRYYFKLGDVRSISNSSTSFNNSVTIGDITIDNPPRSSAPHLIPNLPSRLKEFHDVNASLPPIYVGHLRWIMQKDMMLGQDFLLLGSPNLARER